MNKRINIGLTIGDPAGIGYEVALKFLKQVYYTDLSTVDYDITLFCHRFILDKAINDIFDNNYPSDFNSKFIIVEPDNPLEFDFEYGVNSVECGNASMQYIKKAVKYAENGLIDAIVTLPINKYSISLAGYDFVGHTEYLAHLTGSKDISMMMMSNDFKIVLVTTHLPLKDVAKAITKQKIVTAIQNAHNAGRFFGVGVGVGVDLVTGTVVDLATHVHLETDVDLATGTGVDLATSVHLATDVGIPTEACNNKPKIAVCSLNPHAGDSGAIGVEEITLINPTIEEVRKNGIDVYGSFPADTIYTDKTYDFFIAMYHDQALIPIKLNSFGEAVNVTLGLNIIRTSVDHGTAFNIAGKGVASISSLIKAVDIAKIMITNKKVDTK